MAVSLATPTFPEPVNPHPYSLGFLPSSEKTGSAKESLLLANPVIPKGGEQRLFVGLDTGGLHHRFLQRERLLHPELDTSSSNIVQLYSRYHGEPYFLYSSWWLQCTNLQSLPKRANGVAIAVVSNHLGTRMVELGADVEHTSYHMIYALYQNKVSSYHNDHQHYATFQPSWFNLVDQCVSQRINRDSTFDGMFSQPFRVLLQDLQVPQPATTIHFLSQCYGAAPSSLSAENQKLMAKCVSSDNCFQCSPISPSLIFPNKWRLPFYQESCFMAETATRREGKANELGQTRPGMGWYKKPINAAWKPIATNAFTRFKCNQEMDSCADCVYLVPGSHLMRGMRGTRTTKNKLSTGRLPRLFYLPYLNIGLDPPDVRFALLELHSLRLLLSRTRTGEEHDRFSLQQFKVVCSFRH
jgi:hypothetical protein